jgi:hypothetical protein
LVHALQKPSIGLPPALAALYTALIGSNAHVLEIAGELQVLKRDPQDNHVLECALTAGTAFLVTGNRKHYEELGLDAAGALQFFGNHAPLTDAKAFAAYLAPLRNSEWVVYSKRPFGGPEEVLRYLARYTHRVAISNRRLVALDADHVTFRYKDYRRNGQERYRTMTLVPGEFIRRFLLHVLPKGFHRIRHYGLLASATRQANIARALER